MNTTKTLKPLNLPLNLPLTCFLVLFATLAIAGVGGMAVVGLRQQIANTARKLQATEAETARLERMSEELRAKIAMLENPTALKMVASKLGMQPARLDQYRLMGMPMNNETRVQDVAKVNTAQDKEKRSYAKDF